MINKNLVTFIPVKKNQKDTNLLYNLLSKRSYGISHKKLPSLRDHNKFVKNTKYRYWYFIIINKKYIGTFYIKKDNSIGLNLNIIKGSLVKIIINYIDKKFKPLPEIKSERINTFHYNVSPENKKLIKELKKLNYKVIQLTFLK